MVRARVILKGCKQFDDNTADELTELLRFTHAYVEEEGTFYSYDTGDFYLSIAIFYIIDIISYLEDHLEEFEYICVYSDEDMNYVGIFTPARWFIPEDDWNKHQIYDLVWILNRPIFVELDDAPETGTTHPYIEEFKSVDVVYKQLTMPDDIDLIS